MNANPFILFGTTHIVTKKVTVNNPNIAYNVVINCISSKISVSYKYLPKPEYKQNVIIGNAIEAIVTINCVSPKFSELIKNIYRKVVYKIGIFNKKAAKILEINGLLFEKIKVKNHHQLLDFAH